MFKRVERSLLSAFAALAVGLGFWGYAAAGSNYLTGGHAVHPLTWLEAGRCLVASLGLVGFIHLFQPGSDPWQLVIAQFAVPLAALLWIGHLLLGGIRKNVRAAAARQLNGHTVVCGLGEAGMQAVQSLYDAGQRAVAVDLADDSANAATCEHLRVPVLRGDAKNRQVLLAAGIDRAKAVVIATGSDSENMEIALRIKEICAGRSMFLRQKLQVLARMSSGWIGKRILSSQAALSTPEADVRFFNPCVNAARMLAARLHVPLAPEFEASAFAIAGFGDYGREIALQLMRCSPVAPGKKLHIVVFDRDAESAREQFASTASTVAGVASIEFVTATLEPGSKDWGLVDQTLARAGTLLGAALALGGDEESLFAALEMRAFLDGNGNFQAPVFGCVKHQRQLGGLMGSANGVSGPAERIQIFGTLEETLSMGVLFGSELDGLAKSFHDHDLRRGQAEMRAPWEELPERVKMPLRGRADRAPLVMEAAGLHLVRGGPSPAGLPPGDAETELLARLEHRGRAIEQRLMEWDTAAGGASFLLDDWTCLSDAEQNASRSEAAHLPQVMAGIGIESMPARTVRLYGEWLATAAEELAPILQAPHVLHCNLIVDLDDAEAVQLSVRAFDLPSLSVWLFSRERPPEFAGQDFESVPGPRGVLLKKAAGWTPRELVCLQTPALAVPVTVAPAQREFAQPEAVQVDWGAAASRRVMDEPALAEPIVAVAEPVAAIVEPVIEVAEPEVAVSIGEMEHVPIEQEIAEPAVTEIAIEEPLAKALEEPASEPAAAEAAIAEPVVEEAKPELAAEPALNQAVTAEAVAAERIVEETKPEAHEDPTASEPLAAEAAVAEPVIEEAGVDITSKTAETQAAAVNDPASEALIALARAEAAMEWASAEAEEQGADLVRA